MTLVNAILHQQGVPNKYRIELGIIQIGIVEMTMGLGFLYALVKGGSEEQKQSLLGAVAAGDKLLALAADERARHAPYSVGTRAMS